MNNLLTKLPFSCPKGQVDGQCTDHLEEFCGSPVDVLGERREGSANGLNIIQLNPSATETPTTSLSETQPKPTLKGSDADNVCVANGEGGRIVDITIKQRVAIGAPTPFLCGLVVFGGFVTLWRSPLSILGMRRHLPSSMGGMSSFFVTSLPSSGELDREVKENPKARKNRHTSHYVPRGNKKEKERPKGPKWQRLNGNNGSWTNTDDVESAKAVFLECLVVKGEACREADGKKRHYHRRKKDGGKALDSAARRFLEKQIKEGAKTRQSPYWQCEHEIEVCPTPEKHFHFFGGGAESENKEDRPKAVAGKTPPEPKEVGKEAKAILAVANEHKGEVVVGVKPEQKVVPGKPESTKPLVLKEKKKKEEIKSVKKEAFYGPPFGKEAQELYNYWQDVEDLYVECLADLDAFAALAAPAVTPVPVKVPLRIEVEEVGADAEAIVLLPMTPELKIAIPEVPPVIELLPALLEGEAAFFEEEEEKVPESEPLLAAPAERFALVVTPGEPEPFSNPVLNNLAEKFGPALVAAKETLSQVVQEVKDGAMDAHRAFNPPPPPPLNRPEDGFIVVGRPARALRTKNKILYYTNESPETLSFFRRASRAILKILPGVVETKAYQVNEGGGTEVSGETKMAPHSDITLTFVPFWDQERRRKPFTRYRSEQSQALFSALGFNSFVEAPVFVELLEALRSTATDEARNLQSRPCARITEDGIEAIPSFCEAVASFMGRIRDINRFYECDTRTLENTASYYLQQRMIRKYDSLMKVPKKGGVVFGKSVLR